MPRPERPAHGRRATAPWAAAASAPKVRLEPSSGVLKVSKTRTSTEPTTLRATDATSDDHEITLVFELRNGTNRTAAHVQFEVP